MEHKEYNGWYNYETWNCKLWLDNDEANQELQQEWLKASLNDVDTLEDIIENYIRENTPEVPGMYADLLNAAISEINFREIAHAIIDDNKDN